MSEQHRYFPDWTLRSLSSGPDFEADENSYLAGGYAEEFGYRARISWSPNVSELDGDVPESHREQRSRALPVHPGYPFKPHPYTTELDIDSDEHASAAITRGSEPVDQFADDAVAARTSTFVVVSNRPRAQHSGVRPRAASASIRLAAALVALRWSLRRRWTMSAR
jgi:hypothetical protein